MLLTKAQNNKNNCLCAGQQPDVSARLHQQVDQAQAARRLQE